MSPRMLAKYKHLHSYCCLCLFAPVCCARKWKSIANYLTICHLKKETKKCWHKCTKIAYELDIFLKHLTPSSLLFQEWKQCLHCSWSLIFHNVDPAVHKSLSASIKKKKNPFFHYTCSEDMMSIKEDAEAKIFQILTIIANCWWHIFLNMLFKMLTIIWLSINFKSHKLYDKYL